MYKHKDKSQIEQQIVYNLIQIFEICPQYTISQHLTHILRKKNAKRDTYEWDDSFTLKRFEQYLDEIKQDLILYPEGYEPD